MSGDAKLAHEKHVHRSAEPLRDFSRHGEAAPRQAEHGDVRAKGERGQ
jgi:hypothetical protein